MRSQFLGAFDSSPYVGVIGALPACVYFRVLNLTRTQFAWVYLCAHAWVCSFTCWRLIACARAHNRRQVANVLLGGEIKSNLFRVCVCVHVVVGDVCICVCCNDITQHTRARVWTVHFQSFDSFAAAVARNVCGHSANPLIKQILYSEVESNVVIVRKGCRPGGYRSWRSSWTRNATCI